MSFRYSNQLTARLKRRVTAVNATRRLLAGAPSFVGTCHGVRVSVDASGTVTAITVVDRAAATAALCVPARRNAADADAKAAPQPVTAPATAGGSGEADAEKVAMAVRAATWTAQRRRLDALREIERQAFAATAGDTAAGAFPAEDRFAREDVAAAAAPRAWEAIRDRPLLAALAGDNAAPGVASSGAARAALPLVLATNPDWAPALLPLVTPDADTCTLRPAAPGAAQAYAERRAELAAAERSFWQRADLIKKAQVNVADDAPPAEDFARTAALAASVKPAYAHHAATRALGEAPEAEKITLKFVE